MIKSISRRHVSSFDLANFCWWSDQSEPIQDDSPQGGAKKSNSCMRDWAGGPKNPIDLWTMWTLCRFHAIWNGCIKFELCFVLSTGCFRIIWEAFKFQWFYDMSCVIYQPRAWWFGKKKVIRCVFYSTKKQARWDDPRWWFPRWNISPPWSPIILGPPEWMFN